jgi:hypothetical protein
MLVMGLAGGESRAEHELQLGVQEQSTRTMPSQTACHLARLKPLDAKHSNSMIDIYLFADAADFGCMMAGLVYDVLRLCACCAAGLNI